MVERSISPPSFLLRLIILCKLTFFKQNKAVIRVTVVSKGYLLVPCDRVDDLPS